MNLYFIAILKHKKHCLIYSAVKTYKLISLFQMLIYLNAAVVDHDVEPGVADKMLYVAELLSFFF